MNVVYVFLWIFLNSARDLLRPYRRARWMVRCLDRDRRRLWPSMFRSDRMLPVGAIAISRAEQRKTDRKEVSVVSRLESIK